MGIDEKSFLYVIQPTFAKLHCGAIGAVDVVHNIVHNDLGGFTYNND